MENSNSPIGPGVVKIPAEGAAVSWPVRLVSVLFLLLTFLLGVKGLGDGFKMLGQDFLTAFFSATQNPFIALMVGVFCTTLVQSSSVTTSMVVGLVAAPENPLPLANAIPMIMGANIGTTVTNTVVSLGHVGRRDEFRRAFAVATCHDFFNFITVAVLLPVELLTGFLGRSASYLALLAGEMGGYEYQSPLKSILSAGFVPIEALSKALFEPGRARGVTIVLVAAILIFLSLMLLVKVMRAAVQSRVEIYVNNFLGRSAVLSILIGTIVTFMVQSSSITTSLLVPLAGAGIVSLRQAFPITLGANIGTTVTALLAALATSGANAQAGLIIALVHLLFNLTGTILIYPVRAVREIPLAAARGLAGIAVRSRGWALAYILLLFYALPAVFAILNRMIR